MKSRKVLDHLHYWKDMGDRVGCATCAWVQPKMFGDKGEVLVEPEKDPGNGVGEQGSTESQGEGTTSEETTTLRSAQRLSLGCDSREYPGGVQGTSLGNKQF